jgi:RNA polymerase sigma-70 factor (ECF subfamily)
MHEVELANRFDRQRPQMRAVAYRILGSVSDADDAVQEAWLRLRRTDTEQIDSLERWLTTVVARICLNMVRSRRTRGEQPLDRFLPEPIIDDPAVGTGAAAVRGPVRCGPVSVRSSLRDRFP